MIKVINKEACAIQFKDLEVKPGEASTFMLRSSAMSNMGFATNTAKYMLKLEQPVSFVDSPITYNCIDLETGHLYSCSEDELVAPANFKLEQVE